jgi:hypothetical protein
MMIRIIWVILFACTGWLAVSAQQTDMTVFGFKLGDAFSIPECPCSVVEMKSGVYTGKPFEQFNKYKGYQYSMPATGYCFQRKNLAKYTVRKKDRLDSLPPVKNEVVEITFAPNEAPAMCPLGWFDAIVLNGKLTGIGFDILTADAGKDFDILKNKYGPNVSVQNYTMQNGYGASVDYFEAIWNIPNLRVDLLSSQHRMLSDKFGRIMISLPLAGQQAEDKRPL